jgi:two-component system, cell cycle sensor histidine kinase and response regulator CckA
VPHDAFPLEPSRPTEAARLELARTSINDSPTLKDVFHRACELAAQAIEVERVGIWLFVENGAALRCANLFERSKGEHSSGTILRVADYPTYFSSLTIRKAVPAEIAATDPHTAELAVAYLRPLNIASMLDAGIFVNGELVGVVCHEHVGRPREWTTEARDFAGSIADLIAAKMQAAEVNELRAAFHTQEQHLAAMEKIDALAQMASGVAHDFRNLMTVITGHSEMLRRRPDLPPEIHEQAQDIYTAAQSGIDLVNELLEFARPNGHAPTVLDLSRATEEFLPVLRAAVGAKHPIRFHPPPAVGQVLIDRTQFTRILLNLAVNSRDAMPKGGPINIRIAPVKATDNQGLSIHFVMLEVVDTGIGMEEQMRKHAFEPFRTSKKQGTGLGLAIVRRIVDATGGRIRIESEPGSGTTIRIFFPRVGASSGGTAEFPIPPEIMS